MTTICPEVSHDGGPRLLLLEDSLEQRGSTAMRLAAPSLGGHDVVPKWLRKERSGETSSSPPRKRKA